MNYLTLFDITTVGYKSLPSLGPGFIIFCVGLLVFFANEKLKNRIFGPFWTKSRLRIFSIIYTGFAALFSISGLVHTYSDYSRLKSAFLNNQCEIVEGVVTQFVPMPVTGHADESFTVNNHSFRYSDYELTAGFNNTQSHGGPIKAGLQVRIHCLGNEIAKLEIAR